MIEMFKARRPWFIGMLLAVVALCVSSCDSDDDDYYDSSSSPLCGEWYSPETDTYFDFYGDGSGEFERADGYDYDFTWSAGSGWLGVYFYDGTVWNFNWSFAPNGCLQLYNTGTGYTTVYWKQ
ncbi:hypothetical protein [uncultured Muribaculum sp.]|uniref:hypothetical protein n=1 Tax=uncultured Muribaculum sp. TaxID=1918613 RepID=UPI0025F35382|nr:hypothetical protein [uncultured Muribaculum sp.]